MSNTTRRALLIGFLGGLSQAIGTVVLARSVLPAGPTELKGANRPDQPQADFQERADQVAAELGSCDEEGEASTGEFVNGGFRNGGGGAFRKGGFANGGGGGFRNGAFGNGGGFRNGAFANGGGFHNGAFGNGGGFRNGAFRNY